MKQLTKVGKINSRYRVIQLMGRYFIIDYANPSKIRSYFWFFWIFGDSWVACEIRKSDIKNIT
jgi:hypothetical protein